MTYVAALVFLQILNPLLSHILYEKSKDHIRWLDQYRTPTLTWYMHFCSIYGDGGDFPNIYVLIGAMNINKGRFNSLYLMNYLLQTMLIGAYFCYSLKVFFISSRPFFDDISYADLGIKDCSAEFGNPSAHSLLATLTIPVFLWQM